MSQPSKKLQALFKREMTAQPDSNVCFEANEGEGTEDLRLELAEAKDFPKTGK